MRTYLEYDIVMTSENDMEVFDRLCGLSDTDIIFRDIDRWAENKKISDTYIMVKHEDNLDKYFILIVNGVPTDDNGNKMILFESGDIYWIYVFFLKMREDARGKFEKDFYSNGVKAVRISVKGWIERDEPFIIKSRIYTQLKSYERHK